MEVFLSGLVAQYPWAVAIVAAVGTFRLIFKPLMTFLHEVVLVTPTLKDDAILGSFEAGPIYKGLMWVVDLLTSIKPAPKV